MPTLWLGILVLPCAAVDRLVTWCSNMIIDALELCAIARQSLFLSVVIDEIKFAIYVFFETYCGTFRHLATHGFSPTVITSCHRVLRLADLNLQLPPQPSGSTDLALSPYRRRLTMGLSRSTKIYILLAIDVSFFFAEIITGHTKFGSHALHPSPALTLPLRLCRGLTRPCRRLFPYA